MESFANRRAFWQVENMGISGSDTLFSRIFVSKYHSEARKEEETDEVDDGVIVGLGKHFHKVVE